MRAIQTLTISDGSITEVKHDISTTFTASDGKVHRNLPPRTVVRVELHPASGSHIRVEIWLPDLTRWNSRFLGIGNGGAAGVIPQGELATHSAKGYAVATTDLGTAPNADSGIGNPEVWKDFGFRATHVMTVTAKQVITAYYGKGAEFSYFRGGSTGGQQALQEAQRYPEDYDGIVAALPAHSRTPLHAYFLWNDHILKKCPFTKTQEANVIAAGNEYLAKREIPTVAGKFISDPRGTVDDIEAVIALALQKDPTLTPEHAEALRKLFTGPRHAISGERIFNGVPFGTSFETARGHLYLFRWVFGTAKSTDDINFGEDIDTYTAALGPYLNAENPDLTAFEKRGGKFIMTTGAADAVVPFHATLDYYERVIEHVGSLEQTQTFFRFYIVPGMGHGSGPGINRLPDQIELVRAWRERGEVPNSLEGLRIIDEKTELALPIYPYPKKAMRNPRSSAIEVLEGPRGGVERISPRFLPQAKP